ncbi:MAG: flavodoxin family protein [Promethearchaeota archaeon]
MKVLAINGSPRPEGNTAQLIEMVFIAIKKENENIETELIQLAGKKINPCISCFKCIANRNDKCAQNDDLNDVYAKMIEADAIIIGSPVYYGDVSGKTKCLIERSGFVQMANGNKFKRKLGAAVIAVRRQGACRVWNSINMLFGISNMIIVGSSYWNMGIGLNPGDVQKDSEGKDTMKNLGKNIAWLLTKIHS